MPIQRYNYRGDTNLGFYTTLTNEYAVVPREYKKKDALPEKTVETRITGTNLVGLFTAGNSNQLLIPESTKKREKQKLEDTGIEYTVIKSVENALGNVILANDQGALISPEIAEYSQKISEALKVPVETGKIAGIPNPGVTAIANNHGAVLHRDASEEEAEKVKEALKLEKVNIGTINMGSPYMGSGAAANDQNILVGEDTTGPEIGRIDRNMHRQE
ncbi:MAG: translation initiation factor IF-6 [Candidatus Nanohaloarchaea archaeon]